MARIKPQTLLLQSKKKKGPSRVSFATIILYALIIGLISLSLVATFRHRSRRSVEQSDIDSKNFEVPHKEAHEDSKKYDLPGYAILSTSKGDITVELAKDIAPGIVDKFLDLSQKGEFKDMPFQDVVKNYLIRGGHSKAAEAADSLLKEGKLRTQLLTRHKHDPFVLGTSKKQTDDKSFDLFITTSSIPDLDDKLVVFGRVIGGENVVKQIEGVEADEQYHPKTPISIDNVTLKHEI